MKCRALFDILGKLETYRIDNNKGIHDIKKPWMLGWEKIEDVAKSWLLLDMAICGFLQMVRNTVPYTGL